MIILDIDIVFLQLGNMNGDGGKLSREIRSGRNPSTRMQPS